MGYVDQDRNNSWTPTQTVVHFSFVFENCFLVAANISASFVRRKQLTQHHIEEAA